MTPAVVVVFIIRRYDFIEIRDGTLENADVLGRHCSNIAPATIISSGPSLQIRFVSDYAHQGAGFSLRYEIFKTGENEQDEGLELEVLGQIGVIFVDKCILGVYPRQ